MKKVNVYLELLAAEHKRVLDWQKEMEESFLGLKTSPTTTESSPSKLTLIPANEYSSLRKGSTSKPSTEN